MRSADVHERDNVQPLDSDERAAGRSELSAATRHQIVYEWNQTRADFPDVCAHELFEQQVSRNPSATALVFNGERLTYGDLNERANQVAHHLRRRGVGPDMLVGVSLHRAPTMVIGRASCRERV